jgi:selenide, water dikinase
MPRCGSCYEANVPEEIRTILFDPQTAGGLLLSVSRSDAGSRVTALNNAGVPAVEIGEVLSQGKPSIRIV